LALLAFERYEREIARLTRRDASELIDHIQTTYPDSEGRIPVMKLP